MVAGRYPVMNDYALSGLENFRPLEPRAALVAKRHYALPWAFLFGPFGAKWTTGATSKCIATLLFRGTTNFFVDAIPSALIHSSRASAPIAPIRKAGMAASSVGIRCPSNPELTEARTHPELHFCARSDLLGLHY